MTQVTEHNRAYCDEAVPLRDGRAASNRRRGGCAMDQELVLKIDEDGADEERLDSLATTLRSELLELDVDDVRRPSAGEAPEGSRALELAAIGALLVSLTGSTEAISSVVNTIRGWLSRGSSGRSVEVTIGDRTLKLTAATDEQQDAVVQEFLRSAAAG
jgi:hypothetical protein